MSQKHLFSAFDPIYNQYYLPNDPIIFNRIKKLKEINKTLLCSKCNTGIKYVPKTQGKRAYFAHLNLGLCENYDEEKNYELHKRGIQKIKYKLENDKKIIINIQKHPLCNKYNETIILEEGDEIKTEYPIKNGIPDLVIIDKYNKIKCIIEICFTHKTEKRPEPWYEIDIFSIFFENDLKCIRNRDFKQCEKCNLKFEEIQLKLNEEIQKSMDRVKEFNPNFIKLGFLKI
jgi:hypothetical protein